MFGMFEGKQVAAGLEHSVQEGELGDGLGAAERQGKNLGGMLRAPAFILHEIGSH